MDVIRSGQLDQEGRYDIEEQDERFRHGGTNKIQSAAENDHIENVVNEACMRD